MSKRAEEMVLKILSIAYPDSICLLRTSDKLKAAALIDAELLKERENAAGSAIDHVLLDWLACDDESDKDAIKYVQAHRQHLVTGSLDRIKRQANA